MNENKIKEMREQDLTLIKQALAELSKAMIVVLNKLDKLALEDESAE